MVDHVLLPGHSSENIQKRNSRIERSQDLALRRFSDAVNQLIPNLEEEVYRARHPGGKHMAFFEYAKHTAGRKVELSLVETGNCENVPKLSLN